MQDHPFLSQIAVLPTLAHATCVAVGTRGALLVGPSGSGKSALALQLIALGAELVADDQCQLADAGGRLIASHPANLPHALEARGLGLIAMPCRADVEISAVIDMKAGAKDRMPERQTCTIGPYHVPLLGYPDAAHGPAALYLFLKHGFHD